MSLVAFLNTLQESARVAVAPPARGDLQGAAVAGVVSAMDRAARVELAFQAPQLLTPAAAWAAGRLYRACQFLAYREIEADVVRAEMAIACPVAPSADACYSADLSFRFLPDLIALARGIAADDPLVAGLIDLARGWPLSSVGASGVGAVDVSAFIGDASLRRLYADRIIERADVSRISDAAAREAVAEAIGAHPELAPAAIIKALAPAHVEEA
jgi:hypothetical protein